MECGMIMVLLILATGVKQSTQIGLKPVAASFAASVAASDVFSPEATCGDANSNSFLLMDAVTHLASTLPPDNLRVVFQDVPDRCLIESLWSKNIVAQVLTTPGLWEALESSSYKHPTQILLFGDVAWMAFVMSKAASFYSSAKLNAMKTRWLWVEAVSPAGEGNRTGWPLSLEAPQPNPESDVIQPNPENSVIHPSPDSSFLQQRREFSEAMYTMSRALTEGVRGLFVSSGERAMASPTSSSSSEEEVLRWVNIGSIDAPGDGSWELELSGTWSQKGMRTYRPLWPEVSFDLRGRTIRIGCLKKPTVFFYDGDDAHLKDTNGYGADIAREIQRRLNFTDVLVPNTGFGAFRNGAWNGMVGDLYRGKSDVSPTDFTPIWQRTFVIDFGLIYSTDPVVIISKAPTVYLKPLLLLEIFTPFVWCSIVAVGLVAGISLGALMRIKQILGHPRDNIKSPLVYASASLKIIVIQASNKIWPSWSGGQLLGGCMMLLSVIISSLYRGSITAYLAIPFRSQPINSLEEMLERNVVPAIRLLSSPYSFFLTENSGVLGERVREIMVTFSGLQVSSWTFLKQVAEGKYAWIDTASSAVGRSGQYEEIGKQCLYHVARNPVRIDLDAFGFPKNSIVKYQFDEIMRWLRNYGIIEKIKNNYYSQDCISVAASEGPQIISIAQVQGAFYVLGIGFLFAATALLLEGLVFVCFKKD